MHVLHVCLCSIIGYDLSVDVESSVYSSEVTDSEYESSGGYSSEVESESMIT